MLNMEGLARFFSGAECPRWEHTVSSKGRVNAKKRNWVKNSSRVDYVKKCRRLPLDRAVFALGCSILA
jgi:hypothetical protein